MTVTGTNALIYMNYINTHSLGVYDNTLTVGRKNLIGALSLAERQNVM